MSNEIFKDKTKMRQVIKQPLFVYLFLCYDLVNIEVYFICWLISGRLLRRKRHQKTKAEG